MSRHRHRSDLPRGDPRHGTENGYNNLKCRCAACTEAHRLVYRQYRAAHPERREIRNARKRAQRVGPERAPVPYDPAALDARIQSSEPKTLQEWQYAADLAALALSIDAARQFGLITGGPIVNHARCDEIIAGAESRGLAAAPTDDLTRTLVRELMAGDSREGSRRMTAEGSPLTARSVFAQSRYPYTSGSPGSTGLEK
jgi:hypothetical protein